MCIKSFFPYKDRIDRSQKSRIIYRANCWDCDGFYIGKTKNEHFKALAKNDSTSAIADRKTTGHDIKWDHFDILAKGKTDYRYKIKRPDLFKNSSQLSMSTSEVKSWCFINLL